MKKYSHAWLAFKAIERLEKAEISKYRKEADELVRWLRNHRDGLIQGAWYPDMVFKDMASSHVLKFRPDDKGQNTFRQLPPGSLFYKAGKESPLYGKAYRVDPKDNLPARCEAWAHHIVDSLKIQEIEDKGSPIVPSDNQIASSLFILSHYIADGHMPLHCDSRAFSSGKDLHGKLESVWEQEIDEHFALDKENERFFYNPDGYPLRKDSDYSKSFLKQVDDGLSSRPFSLEYGEGNSNVEEYMWAVCQYSYLIAYRFIPQEFDVDDIDMKQWQSLPGSTLPLARLSPLVFSEAIDAIARIWLRAWRRYSDWKK
jgi:hypothetical protein